MSSHSNMLFSSSDMENRSHQVDLGAVGTPLCPSLAHNHLQVSCWGTITVSWLRPSPLIVHHLSFQVTLYPPRDVTAQSADLRTAAQYCAARESWLRCSRAAQSFVLSVGTWMWSSSRWWMRELLTTSGTLGTSAHICEGPGVVRVEFAASLCKWGDLALAVNSQGSALPSGARELVVRSARAQFKQWDTVCVCVKGCFNS